MSYRIWRKSLQSLSFSPNSSYLLLPLLNLDWVVYLLCAFLSVKYSEFILSNAMVWAMIVSQDWDLCPLHFCSRSSQMLSHRIVFFLWSSSWCLGRHHKHLCRNLCNCTCRCGLFWTDPSPRQNTVFSSWLWRLCVFKNSFRKAHTYILL